MHFETILNEKGVLTYTIRGRSMMPLLKEDRDVVIIQAQQNDFEIGDVVLFQRDNGQYVLHRISKIDPAGYEIIGDNCLYGEFVRADQLLGRMIRMVRGGKEVDLNDPAYRFYLRLLPLQHFGLKIKNKLRKIFR